MVIMGGKDYSLRFPGIEDYIKSGRAKIYVPNYETAYIAEGSHFMQEQFPEQVNELILNFLTRYRRLNLDAKNVIYWESVSITSMNLVL